jgi:hypothetical protein
MDVPPVPPDALKTPPVASTDAGGLGLQFDTADFGASGAVTCAGCKQPTAGEYYEVNGQTFCPACKAQVERLFGDRPGAAGFLRALGGGLAGGAAGALLYSLVFRLNGYPFGILAIAVGWLVGHGVRLGTGSRGGALYQALAIVLTLVAIVASYVPMVVAQADAAGAIEIAGRAIAAPVQLLLQGRLAIVAVPIGLFEAWRLNKRVRLTVTGPFHGGFGRQSAFPTRAAASGIPSV